MKNVYSMSISRVGYSAPLVSIWTSSLAEVAAFAKRNHVEVSCDGKFTHACMGDIRVNYIHTAAKVFGKSLVATDVATVNSMKKMLQAAGFEVIAVDYENNLEGCRIQVYRPNMREFIGWCVRNCGYNVDRHIDDDYVYLRYRVNGIIITVCYPIH